jgi:hypothetical protein
MRFFFFTIFLIAFTSLQAFSQKDTLKYEKLYTKEYFKKEKEDLKVFLKMSKEWTKGIKKPNFDYLASQFSKLNAQMEKEHSELSLRIANRNRSVSSSSKSMSRSDSLKKADLPVGYNPTIKGQIENFTKEEINKKRTESDILSVYGKVIRTQKAILTKLKNIKEITPETLPSSLNQISEDLNNFQLSMKEELRILKNETGVKKK